jgi:hypothetical protein
MLKEAEMTEDACVETVPGTNPEEAVHAEVTKIMKEKRSVSDGFDDTGGVRGRTFGDGDQEERSEV